MSLMAVLLPILVVLVAYFAMNLTN